MISILVLRKVAVFLCVRENFSCLLRFVPIVVPMVARRAVAIAIAGVMRTVAVAWVVRILTVTAGCCGSPSPGPCGPPSPAPGGVPSGGCGDPDGGGPPGSPPCGTPPPGGASPGSPPGAVRRDGGSGNEGNDGADAAGAADGTPHQPPARPACRHSRGDGLVRMGCGRRFGRHGHWRLGRFWRHSQSAPFGRPLDGRLGLRGAVRKRALTGAVFLAWAAARARDGRPVRVAWDRARAAWGPAGGGSGSGRLNGRRLREV